MKAALEITHSFEEEREREWGRGTEGEEQEDFTFCADSPRPANSRPIWPVSSLEIESALASSKKIPEGALPCCEEEEAEEGVHAHAPLFWYLS